MVTACGSSQQTVDEFCELSREGDIETVRLFQMSPGTTEFDDQLQLVRNINDRLFSNAPDGIAEVAEELGPMLLETDADNDRVNVLLDQVAAFVAQNCAAG